MNLSINISCCHRHALSIESSPIPFSCSPCPSRTYAAFLWKYPFHKCRGTEIDLLFSLFSPRGPIISQAKGAVEVLNYYHSASGNRKSVVRIERLPLISLTQIASQSDASLISQKEGRITLRAILATCPGERTDA